MRSEFALIDVKQGRKALVKRLKTGAKIPVTLTGYITHVWGNDDGVSIEFACDVETLTLGEDIPAK